MSGEKRRERLLQIDLVSDTDRVMRFFWMKESSSAAAAAEEADTSLLVTVHYREDVDESWIAVYVDTHVRFYLSRAELLFFSFSILFWFSLWFLLWFVSPRTRTVVLLVAGMKS